MTVVDVDTITLPRERDPRRWIDPLREITRGLIAILLFALLAAEVIYGFCEIRAISHEAGAVVADKQAMTKMVMDLLNVVIPPTVALFGAATGFYYGTRAGTERS